jgi:transposase
MRMGASEAHASQDIAIICGVSRAKFLQWAKSFREGGFDALLEREKPGPKGMKLRGVPEAVDKELRTGVECGRGATAEAARIWIQKERGIKRPYVTLVVAKKFRRGAASAAAQTPQIDPEAADKFKQELGANLEALPVLQGSRVRVWVMDEARFGLQTEMRRASISKGVRPRVRRQTCYEWDCFYGALHVHQKASILCPFHKMQSRAQSLRTTLGCSQRHRRLFQWTV